MTDTLRTVKYVMTSVSVFLTLQLSSIHDMPWYQHKHHISYANLPLIQDADRLQSSHVSFYKNIYMYCTQHFLMGGW